MARSTAGVADPNLAMHSDARYCLQDSHWVKMQGWRRSGIHDCSSLCDETHAQLYMRNMIAQGAEKTIISKMLVGGSDKRTYAIDKHAGVVSAVPCMQQDFLL